MTWNTLIAAIAAAGGPTYQYRQIDPVDDQDGGEPGGNIRQGFLFRTDRGLAFVDRPGGTSTNATAVVRTPPRPAADVQPGPDRARPTRRSTRAASRSPASSRGRARPLIVVANHFNSKGGDDPLFGHLQPPVRSSESSGTQQARIVNAFARDIQRADVAVELRRARRPQRLRVLRDACRSSRACRCSTCTYLLPPNERYSYVFDGNSQALDHILVSPALLLPLPEYDSVHVNSEFTTSSPTTTRRSRG